MKNLWKVSAPTTLAPNTIIEAQAQNLTEATNGLVVGEIITKTPSTVSSYTVSKVSPITNNPNILVCTFNAIVPNLSYRLQIMKIIFSVLEFYPLILNDYINGKEYEVNSEDDLKSKLEEIIPSPNMTKVINNLMIQASIKVAESNK